MIAFADIKSIKRTNKKLFMRQFFFFRSYILNIIRTQAHSSYLAHISVSGAERLNSFFWRLENLWLPIQI